MALSHRNVLWQTSDVKSHLFKTYALCLFRMTSVGFCLVIRCTVEAPGRSFRHDATGRQPSSLRLSHFISLTISPFSVFLLILCYYFTEYCFCNVHVVAFKIFVMNLVLGWTVTNVIRTCGLTRLSIYIWQ